jgi:hypothetical protein
MLHKHHTNKNKDRHNARFTHPFYATDPPPFFLTYFSNHGLILALLSDLLFQPWTYISTAPYKFAKTHR